METTKFIRKTQEFAAVYRLHPLCPPGVVLHNEDESKEFIPFEDLLNEDGRKTLQRSKDTSRMISKSMFEYPCGHLIGSSKYGSRFVISCPNNHL